MEMQHGTIKAGKRVFGVTYGRDSEGWTFKITGSGEVWSAERWPTVDHAMAGAVTEVNDRTIADLQQSIVECLRMFGPSDLRTIQAKLDLRGMVRSQNEIEKAAEILVKSKTISKATGFSDLAYKI